MWSLPELPQPQELLDEWIVAVWQNRPHDALRDPNAPKRAFAPNEKYTMLLKSSGYVPALLSGEDYVELLPERWQAINAHGIKVRTLAKRHNLRCWAVRFALEAPRLTTAETSQLTDPITGELADLVEGLIDSKLNAQRKADLARTHGPPRLLGHLRQHPPLHPAHTNRTASARAESLTSNQVVRGEYTGVG
ncbi:hypothetical protein ACWGH2_43935 [Streptomyces sp. NPDC054871]